MASISGLLAVVHTAGTGTTAAVALRCWGDLLWGIVGFHVAFLVDSVMCETGDCAVIGLSLVSGEFGVCAERCWGVAYLRGLLGGGRV